MSILPENIKKQIANEMAGDKTPAVSTKTNSLLTDDIRQSIFEDVKAGNAIRLSGVSEIAYTPADKETQPVRYALQNLLGTNTEEGQQRAITPKNIIVPDKASNEEILTYKYLAEADKNQAKEYSDYLNNKYSQANISSEAINSLNAPDWVKNVAKTGTALVADILGAGSAVSAAVQQGIYGTVDKGLFEYTDLSQQMRGEIQNDLTEATKDTKWDISKTELGKMTGVDNLATFLLDTGYSALQSLAVGLSLGPAGVTFLAGTAGSSAIKESLDAGDSPDVAVGYGLLAGVFEGAFEYISLDKVIQAKNVDSLKQVLVNYLKYSLVEGSEELATEIADRTAEAIIKGDSSQFAKDKAEYIATHSAATENEANWYAVKKAIGATGAAFVGGALSGGVMGTATDIGGTARTQASYLNTVNKYARNNNTQDLYNILKENAEATGREFTLQENSDKRSYAKEVAKTLRGISTDAISQRLDELGYTGDTKKTAQAIFHAENNYAMSAEEKSLLENESVERIREELNGKGETAWAEQMRMAQYAVTKAYKAKNVESAPEPQREKITPAEADLKILAEQMKNPYAPTEISVRKAINNVELEEVNADEVLSSYANANNISLDELKNDYSAFKAENPLYTAEAYLKTLDEAYQYGKIGGTLQQLGNRQELRDLTTALYTKGTQEYLKSMTNAAKQAEVRRKGYTFRNNGTTAFATERDIQATGLNGARTITESDLSDRNKAEVQALNEFNKGLGIAVKYYVTDMAQGTQEGVFFTNIDGTPTIMLDINAPMLWKYSHEFTHWMKRDTPEIWNQLYQFISERFYSGNENDLLREAKKLKAQQDMADENFKRANGILKSGEEYRSTLTIEDAVEEIVAQHCESIFDNADLLAEVAQKSPTLWDKIREFFAELLDTIKEVIAGYGQNNEYAEQLAKDQQALEKVQSLILQAREVAEQMVETQEIVDEMPAETTEAVDPATTTKYSYRSLAQAYGFTAHEENGERFWATPMGKVSQITKADVLNSPIGAMIDYSKEQGYISDKEYKAQVDLFVEIGNMALKSRDFAMAMQFAGSNIFTGMKQNADKQYKTTYDFPSICTKTQAVIEAMSAAMMKKGGGLTKTEIAREYDRVWAFGNPVPCPECYVFSRWVGIGGLLDNIKKYQTRFLKMDPSEVEREYRKMYDEIESFASKNDLTFGKAKTKLAAKYTKMYTDLTDKIAKAEEAGDEISARDVEKLALVESQMDTVKAMTWIDTVYFADASHTKVNPNAEVPDNVLFDLNAGETFASKYKEAWAFRTTQGAGYGKAITPPAEAVLGEGILINNNASKAIKAKANGELKNIFLEQRGKMSPEAAKILETARRKQLSQAFIGGQRFQSTSDARYDNFSDYLLAALEMQAMHGMVQVYTKVSGAVPVFNLWGFSINQSLMPKNNGLTEDGKLSDTSTGGMIPSVAFRNRLDYESAGTITIGVNDEHIRKLFADINRDFIIPYHASGGDKILISEFRRIQDSDLKTTSQSTDYSKVQGEKLMQDDLLRSLGYTDEQIADVAKFREQRLAIITGRGSIDLNYIKKAGNEVIARLYDQIKNGKWKGVTQPKGVVETQIFPNEYWDESVTYDNSGKIVEDYLEYCRRLGMLHKFSGKTIAYNRKTGQHELVSVHGYDRNGVKVALTDLAYIDGDASKGVEPFFWKVLVDRRMYDNEGNYLPQKFVSLAESDTGITQFARNNEGSAREYDPEKSRRTIEAINADERYSGKGGLIATPEASINDRAESLKGTVASRLSKFSTRTYFGTEATNNLIANKTYGPLVEALVNTIKAETTRFSPNEFIRVYTNNPELDFATRIQDGDGQAAFELADMLSKIDDVNMIDDLRWYALESHPLYNDIHTGNIFNDSKGHLATYAQTHRKGIKEFRRLCDERTAQIMSKDNVGSSLNIKNLTDMPVKDVKALFDKLNHNAELQRLADRVFKIAEGLNIAAVFSSSINQRYGGVWVGNWSRLTGRNGIVCYNTATFNSPQYTDDQKATILLHEMIHAITVNGWHIHNNTIRNTNAVVSDASDIAFNGFKAIYDKLSRSAIGPDLRSSYGMSDIKEFMAEMANPEFRDQLAAVSVPDMNAYLDSLKFLVPVLGGNATGTTLDSLVTILDYYVDSFDPNIDGWGQNVFSRERHYKEYKTLPKYAVRTYEGKMKCQGGSFFSGGGLIDYALKDMVHHEFAVEYDARIAAYYELNNGIPAHGDVTDPKTMEKLRKLSGQIDYFHASPVCKRYSAANNQGGEQPIDVLTAKRTAQGLRILKPKVFTLENVRGYQNSEALRLIKKALNDLGYTWDEGVYNSAQFGADTSRSRYFIRAVMNAELPPMPEYVETSRGWYEAVEDLIPELQESALPNWMRERREKQNVDLKAPGGYIFVMGTGDKNGLVRYYYPDEVVGTFLANGGQPKIITPEGKVLEVTPRIVARLTGLDDSYKLPTEKTRAFQILGNGVPVKLTQAVVAPLLDKTLITPALEEVIRDRKAIVNMARAPRFSTRVGDADIETLKKHFGTTKNFNEAGYLLTDGTMLDFSGKHWTSGNADYLSNSRTVDHRDVNEVLMRDDGIQAMDDMIQSGNIRLMPETGGISIANMPTNKQMPVLASFFNRYKSDWMMVDFEDTRGNTIHSAEYAPNTPYTRIINDIKKFYKDGEISEQSTVSRFHNMGGDIRYSTRDAEYLELAKDPKKNEYRLEKMVKSAAVEAGYNTPMLYHGTPRFGFTAFRPKERHPFIYTSTSRRVSANYAGDNHYAAVAPIGKKYRAGDSLDDIITNAETVYRGIQYRKATEEDRRSAYDKIIQEASKAADKVDELHTRIDFGDDERAMNAEAWMANLMFDARDGDNFFEADSEEERKVIRENWEYDVNQFEKSAPILKEWYDENRKNLSNEQKKYILYLLGYEVGDAAIDIGYTVRRAISASDRILVSEDGHLNDADELKPAMDEAHNIGSYQLYGNLGDKPFEFDANGGQFWALKVPEVSDGYTNTDEVCHWAMEHGYTSVIMHNIYDYGEKADNYVFFNPDQVKSADLVTYDDNDNIIPLSERFQSESNDIRYSTRDANRLTYDYLVSKQAMPIVDVTEAKPKNRDDVVKGARQNAIDYGTKHNDGRITVFVDDLGSEVTIGRDALSHGLDRRFDLIAPVEMHIGEILKNSICINYLNPKDESNAQNTVVLIGIARDGKETRIVESVVNRFTWNLVSVDVLHSVNAKKESTAAPQGPSAFDPTNRTDISIAELLELVNRSFPDILPEDVLKHFGHAYRPEGTLGQNALYSTRYAYTAHITEERVDKYLQSYAIEGSPNTSQAWIGYADNFGFVKATSDYTSFAWVSEGTEKLDPERLRKESQPIFLDVDLDSDGRPVAITGHEGRHRSLAMSREGISRGPVILFDYGHWEKNRDSYPSVYLRGQRNAMDSIFVRDVIPLDYAHRDEIIKTFSELSSNEKMLEKYGGQVLKYSTRTELSNYEILAELLDSRLENKADKDALRIYKNSYNEALKIRSEIDRLNNQLSYEPSQGAEGNIRARIRELQKSLREREKILDQVITKPRIAAVVASQKADVQKLEGYLMDEQMSHQEDIEALEKRLGKLAEKVEQRAQAFRNYRAKVSEQKNANYYRPRIEKIAKSLASQLETTLPMPFRQPIAGVLSMLDFTTKKDGQMRGNKANMDRVAAQAAFAKLSQESVDPLKFYQDYGIALSPEFRDWILEIQQWFNDATSGMTVSDLRAMDSYQLACLYKFLKNIDTQAKRATKLYTAKATDVREVSQRTIGHLIPLEKKEGNRVFKAVDSFFGWKNATPVTVFDRFGTGGQDIWWGFMEAQDKLAIANEEIQAFADEHFKDTDKLRSELVEVEIGGEKISAPISYWMTLYEYLKQQDSYRHLIQGGGFRLEDYNHKGKTVTDKDRFMSEDDIVAVYNALTDEQKAMADEAAKFMREKGAAYGNYVTRALYGYDGFGQIEDYFPIRTIRSMTEEAKVQEEAKGNLYGMMSKSWTKARVLNANNALVVGDIFDVFAKHMGEMATYCSFALPTLDTIKWLNYKEVSKSADKPREESVQTEMKLAFGDDASRYIFDFLDSLNGTAMDRDNSAVMRLVSAKNRVAVGANFRVMIQQPLSVTRAFSLIDPKWFKPYNYKSAHEEMLRYSGIAKWKEDGHYEINISRSLAERIAPNKSQKIGKKVSDVTMAGAEFGDKITWTAIWVACKNEVSSQNPGISEEDLMTKTNERFRDIIYRTQVVDSTLTRSDWMRKKDYLHRITSSFKSEPTQTLNMLMRAVDSFRYDSRTMGASSAWAKNRATVTRTLVAFALTQIVNAAATAVIDAFRDDDDYETWLEKWFAAFKGGVGENMLLLGSVPYVGEIVSLLKGYSPSRPDLDTISNLISTSKQIYNSIKNASMSPKTVFNIVSVASTLTGIPMQNVMRDVVGLYNGTIGILYDLGITDSTSAKWQMSPETNKSGYEAFYSALKEGKSQRAMSLLTEMADNDLDAKKVYTGTYNLVKADLLAGKITKAEAEAYVRQIVDMVGLERSDADIRKLVEGWLD